MSNEERQAIKSAATRLDYNMSDADWKRELDIITKNYNLAAARAKQSKQGGTNTPQSSSNSDIQYQTPMNMSITNPLDPSWSKLTSSRIK